MNGALDWHAFRQEFHLLAKSQGFREEHLAELDGMPLNTWERPADGPCIYLSAGIHGDEPAGPLALLELLRQGFFKPDVHWLLCPLLNPGGLAVGTRENAAGVDLNRDYFLRESAEIIAHAAWIDRLPAPDLFISLHEDWETSGFYFYEINLREDDPLRANSILDAVNPHFPAEPGPEIDGHEVREDGWIYHAAEPDLPEGWPEAIYLAKKGCPLSFTFETPSHAELSSRVAAHVAAVKAAVCHVGSSC
ncbi:MAG: M14 family metallocarboxypeptidase [Verrucomicrobiota bacterium]